MSRNFFASKEKRSAVAEETARRPIHLNQRTPVAHLFFGPYVFFPVLAMGTWLGGLLALLGLWVHTGKPRYQNDEASVVFISDVGARYKTLFIIICSCTSAFYILTLFAERWLRHVDRLPSDVRRREQIFDWIAIFFTCVGSAGLILLSIFDTFNHSTVHWSMTIVFIVGVALSAIFQSAEIWSLHKDHPDRNHLKRNSIYKLIVVTFAIAEAIAFGILYAICSGDAYTSRCNRVTSGAAAMEWAVAFTLIFYWLSLVMDLWPSGKTSPRYLRRLARWQEKNDPAALEHDFSGRNAFAEQPQAWQDPRTGQALPENAPVHWNNPLPNAPGYPSGFDQRFNGDGVASGRPSTQYGSETGLMRQV
ncbi:hypothetical protein NliqN6_4580 [Naganishia liquefaciens]|uniref:CWH43-like N-terminal domain-containing protein n=1 Tax=Naganishia liquefaciens TaxID=104408 RepID=A0A8H3YGD8_9TREE|nr:hypothetical protein NliqN6_4580 [Naganishia liquefaciens]